MVEASRRTAVARARGLANAAFLAAPVEAVPAELVGRACLVTVNFPWGSLLRGVLGCDPAALAGVAALLAPEGRLEVLTSLTSRDAAAARIDPERLDDSGAIRTPWAEAGLDLRVHRPATAEEIAATRSSWAKRLRTGPERPVRKLVGALGGGGASPGRHASPGAYASPGGYAPVAAGSPSAARASRTSG
jgi:16S rRNA (adenine(1408)-N(1))-methyltransferase